MYIWVGCKLPERFEKEIRAKCLTENERIGLSTDALYLPQHISLKISFPTDRGEEILAWLRAYLGEQAAFRVELTAMEQVPGVLWLKVAENAVLERMHRELDENLLHLFGVEQHAYDRCFLFHSSLFVDPDGQKLTAMARALEELVLPESLPVDAFLLGGSPDGKPGNFCVLEEIPAKSVGAACTGGETVL